MNYLVIISMLLLHVTSLAQTTLAKDSVTIVFKGQVEFVDANLRPTRVRVIQGEHSFSTVSRAKGKYFLKGKVDSKRSFLVEFSEETQLTKTITFDISNCDMHLEDSVYTPIESMDMNMVSVDTGLVSSSWSVAQFFCYEGEIKFDEGYSTVQKIRLDNFIANIDSTVNEYYEDGSLKSRIPMDSLGLNGKAVYYYPNGDKMKEIDLENNMLNGRIVEFYEGGNVKFIRYYQQNELIKDERFLDTEDNRLYRTNSYH